MTGRAPKVLLVARETYIPPSTLLRRLATRKVHELRGRAVRVLGLDRPRLFPHMALAVWRWRTSRGRRLDKMHRVWDYTSPHRLYRGMSCCVVSCRVASYRIVQYRIVSYRIVP